MSAWVLLDKYLNIPTNYEYHIFHWNRPLHVKLMSVCDFWGLCWNINCFWWPSWFVFDLYLEPASALSINVIFSNFWQLYYSKIRVLYQYFRDVGSTYFREILPRQFAMSYEFTLRFYVILHIANAGLDGNKNKID